jgi:hypothetical protein
VNDSSASVNDKMQSLRHQARKLAFDYLWSNKHRTGR